MVHRLFIVLAREPKRTRLLPTVLDLRPGTFVESPPSIALEQLSGWKERRPHLLVNGVSESNFSIPR